MKLSYRSVSALTAFVAAFSLIVSPKAEALTLTVAANGNIQSAIDQVAAAGGGTVNIASGSGTITSSLKLKSKVVLNGAGTPATTLTIGGQFTGMVQAAEGLTNVTVQNLKLAGTGTHTNTNCNGITIVGLSAYHKTVKLTNVQVLNCGGQGVHIKRGDGVTVSNCSFHHNAGFTLMHNYYLRESTNATLTGSRMTDAYMGTGVHVAGVCTNITITSNTILNNGSQGINVQDSPTTISIRTNTCNSNGQYDSTRADGLAFTGTGATIDGNTCNYNVGAGIHIWNGSGSLTNNRATGNGGANYDIHGTFSQSNNL